MATSERGKILFEGGQSAADYALMTSSDNQVFNISGGSIFSGKAGFEASVRPNGIVTGRNLITPGTDPDDIDVAAFTAYSKGIEYTVAADTLTLTRPASGTPFQVFSVTMTSAGALAVVDGTEGSAFSTTRDAAGGPPEIPVDSVELGQVKLSSDDAGVILASEIFQVVGTHTERFDFPTWTINPIGLGDSAPVTSKKNAFVELSSALDEIHDAAAAKRVYVSYNAPIFVEASKTLDFVPVENSHSVSSTQYYNGTIASVSSTLGQGSFTALMTDNITDTLVSNKDEILTIKFYPDRNKTPYILTQGKVGLARTFPVSGQNQASVTISSEVASSEFSS